jgi:hypothetical protein
MNEQVNVLPMAAQEWTIRIEKVWSAVHTAAPVENAHAAPRGRARPVESARPSRCDLITGAERN